MINVPGLLPAGSVGMKKMPRRWPGQWAIVALFSVHIVSCDVPFLCYNPFGARLVQRRAKRGYGSNEKIREETADLECLTKNSSLYLDIRFTTIMQEKMKKSYLLLISAFIIMLTVQLLPQSTAGEDAKVEYRYLVDMPTAGVLSKGMVAVTADVMPYGLLIGRLEVGVFEDVSFGISYGGGNIIGSGAPTWYKYPAVNLRYKVEKESVTYPALTIGFDSQGKGEYFDSSSRYAIKSPGLFLGGSKNFGLMGYLTLHATLNYSFEHTDGDNFVDFRVGAEKTIGSRVSVIAEYDFALNDNSTKLYGDGKGYMNIGVRWSPAEGFTLGLDLRDMFDNKRWSPGAADRALRLEYLKPI